MDYPELLSCKLCPRECGVNRNRGELGYCKADNRIKIARCDLHFWEEPCISGEKGSGAVFFSHCTMGCVYCQNYKISTENQGKYVTEEELCEMFLTLQHKGANNINLVTPTHYVPQIITSLKMAKQKGLTLPIVYNTSGYENEETLKMLSGYIDVYLPDMKYFSDRYALRYSNAKNYFECTKKAIAEMFAQTGKCAFDENGIIKKGIIVRHLMLPHLLFDTKKVLDYLHKTYGNNIYISIMSQYTPLATLPCEFPELSKPISAEYYEKMIDYAEKIGIENGFIQEGSSVGESFIPEFFEN